MTSLMRHIRACNNTALPGGRLRLHLGAHPIGWLTPQTAAMIGGRGSMTLDRLTLPDAAALAAAARDLAFEEAFAWRGEAFDVRSDTDGRTLAQIDRGALPMLGLQAHNVHLNGLVRRGGTLHMWVSRRATHKLIAPGKLDHIVAGGVPAGLTPLATLVKEAAEEAGIPPELASAARPAGSISYVMQRPEGLRRETLFCYDLTLPESFMPNPVDGEVDGFMLWPIADVLAATRDTNDFMYDVNLVLIDLFLRLGLLDAETSRILREALAGPAH